MNNHKPEDKSIFSRIIDGEIPAEIVYRDEHCIAIHDINPQAPVHLLLIPIQPIAQLSLHTEADKALLGYLFSLVPRLAKQHGIGGRYRLVVNDGAEAGQSVFHLHLHILGGRKLAWPPG